MKESDIPRDTLRAILERCEPPAKRTKPIKAGKLVEPGIAIGANRLTITVAYQGVAEGNQREWQARNRRSGMAWKAVREAMGSHLAALDPYTEHVETGGALRVKFTRLGGRSLDALVNLPASMKGVEDAIAYLLGMDDGKPYWHPSPAQEESDEIGVRIEIERM
jgi:hypothetical protein